MKKFHFFFMGVIASTSSLKINISIHSRALMINAFVEKFKLKLPSIKKNLSLTLIVTLLCSSTYSQPLNATCKWTLCLQSNHQ